MDGLTCPKHRRTHSHAYACPFQQSVKLEAEGKGGRKNKVNDSGKTDCDDYDYVLYDYDLELYCKR